MKEVKVRFNWSWFALPLLLLVLSSASYAKSRDYYQIQVYRITGKVQEEKVDNFLKSSYLPALHRAGIKKAGVFKPIESDTAAFGKYVYVWIPFESPAHFVKTMDALDLDETYPKRWTLLFGCPLRPTSLCQKRVYSAEGFPKCTGICGSQIHHRSFQTDL